MSDSREEQAVIEEQLRKDIDSPQVKAFARLLELRREKHRDNLEAGTSEDDRGRAKECSALLKVFGK